MKKQTRMKFRDHGFPFRMGSGFAGDVNRTHPASIEAVKVDTTNPPLSYGVPVKINAASQGVRRFIAGDGSATPTGAYGFAVRPFPAQQASGSNYGAVGFDSPVPSTTGAMDVLREGYIMSKMNDSAGTPVKGNPVFVWCAASVAGHVQGQLETAASGTDTVQLTGATFQGGKDANGIAEVVVNFNN